MGDTFPAQCTSGAATEPNSIQHCPLEGDISTELCHNMSLVSMHHPQHCLLLTRTSLSSMLAVTLRLVFTIVLSREPVKHFPLLMIWMGWRLLQLLSREENQDTVTIPVLRGVRGRRPDQVCRAQSQLTRFSPRSQVVLPSNWRSLRMQLREESTDTRR